VVLLTPLSYSVPYVQRVTCSILIALSTFHHAFLLGFPLVP
jgi:hypothetical protein